ncbi:Sas10 C-terminal domain-containing protein [Lasiosphaeria miniovina]|uniref:Sas10 C-terminal domain-containing protein n=1 Tax=Lasiosphaeria miniovina TaxID=1954250 RepID=A0AA40A4S2_9PEZI|nr:Sas10 C-terminal domain-containing protein [Lasiosphaeria miniovina]KAK0709153.1 Sas10 C-terminal domain-containing protein [Lasiosphaeria miniovina]
MAKKRKAPRNSEPAGPREVDPNDARLAVKTYRDVADSEDEYFAKEEDRIDFEDEPRSKRLRRQEKEDAFLEASDEEIFANDNDNSDEEEQTEAAAPTMKQKKCGEKAAAKKDDLSDDDEEQGQRGDQEGDDGWWGTSRKEYYDADVIETEADALEEEAEARRLQVKKLAKMNEADFAFDEGEWLASTTKGEAAADGADEDVVVEVLNDAEITSEMTPDERYKLLQARYPEFDYLVDEFRDLKSMLATLQKEALGKPAKSIEVVKSWVLACYFAALTSYFAILTSPARDSVDGQTKTLSPAELRDHEVMETLMSCREAWVRVEKLKPAKTAAVSSIGMLSPPEEEDLSMSDGSIKPKNKKEKLSKGDIKASKKAADKAKKARAVEQSLADMSALLKGTMTAAARAEALSVPVEDGEDDNRSDFGEEETIDARTAADKVQRKKSLRFYTSQIVQKASRRAGAGRDAGGDMDIPYRERLRDRQARLNVEAERRGKKDGRPGTELGGDGDHSGDDNEGTVAREVRDGEDAYYDMVAHAAQRKRTDKTARHEALAKAKKDERIVESAEIGPDGKRQITYQIQKNKGLMPTRRKEVRNPRVKKRMMYEDKKKKLRSVKATYKGGEGRGGYQGELSGIKTNLVKSTKL